MENFTHFAGNSAKRRIFDGLHGRHGINGRNFNFTAIRLPDNHVAGQHHANAGFGLDGVPGQTGIVGTKDAVIGHVAVQLLFHCRFDVDFGEHAKAVVHQRLAGAREVATGDVWQFTERQTAILEGLKSRAKAAGLWNFWLTDSDRGFGLSTVQYAYLAEEMGKTPLGAEVFNCAAPDTGNMEVFERYGSDKMKEKWLVPLLNGEIRSAYLMTEPEVASSDATNIEMSCVRDGDSYILNGEKWWASRAGDPRCKVYIVMVKTAGEEASKHKRQSMIVVAADTPGIEILRPMEVYGHLDAPHGHMHIKFSDVRVPAEQLLLGEGRGFEIAQGRLLCLKAAWVMDQGNARAAAPWISQIKVVAPLMALKVIDEAVQMFGGQGISQDTPLAGLWTHVRTLRLADGPDAVHRRQVARNELRKYTQEKV
jgi:acyl-CoA dehydrogenase